MKVKLEKFYYYTVFFLTISGIYFLDNNRILESNLFVLDTILSVFTLIFILIIVDFFSRNYVSLSLMDKVLFLLLLIFFFLTLLFRQYVSIHWVYLFTAYIVVKSKITLSYRTKAVAVFLIFLSICIQLCLFESGGRRVLSYIDPNYSGFIIFLFFLFAFRNGFKKTGILIALLGLFTLSRAYLIALLIFFLTNIRWLFFYKLIKQSKFFKIGPLVIGIIFIPLIVGSFYLSTFKNISWEQTKGSDRLGTLVDKSNEHRFLANKFFFEDLFNHPYDYLFGKNLEEYTKTVFINTPHHSVYQVIFNYGILFGIIYLIIFFRLLKVFVVSNNIPYILSVTLYFLFLGGGLYSIQVIFLFFILKESNINESKNRFFYS